MHKWLIVYIYLALYSYLSQRCKHCAPLHSRFSDGQCKSLHALCVQPLRWWRWGGQPSLSPQCLKDKAGFLKNVYNDKAHIVIDQTSGELWLGFYSAHRLWTSSFPAAALAWRNTARWGRYPLSPKLAERCSKNGLLDPGLSLKEVKCIVPAVHKHLDFTCGIIIAF